MAGLELNLADKGSELALLACVIREPSGQELIGCFEPDFFTDPFDKVASLLFELREKSERIEPDSFFSHFHFRYPGVNIGELEKFTRRLQDTLLYDAHFGNVTNHALRRRANKAAHRTLEAIEGGKDIDAILGRLTETVDAMCLTTWKQTKVTMSDVMRRVTALLNSPHEHTDFTTGFWEIDTQEGAYGNECVLLTARYNVGKTPVALRWAAHLAIDRQIPISFWSGENPCDKLALSIIAMRTGVGLRRMMEGWDALTDEEQRLVAHAQHQLMEAPFYWCQWGRASLPKLRTMHKRNMETHGARAFFCDQLPHIQLDMDRYSSRNDACDHISDTIFSWKQEMSGLWVILNQLKTKNVDATPTIHDNMWFTRAEQNADIAWVIDRPWQDKLRIEKAKDRHEYHLRKLDENKQLGADHRLALKEQAERDFADLPFQASISQEKGRLEYGTWKYQFRFCPNALAIHSGPKPQENQDHEFKPF